MKTRIFISYSHSDTLHLEKFRKHFSPLERLNSYELWWDQNLTVGKPLSALAETQKQSDVTLCFLSSDYLASKSCMSEFEIAIEESNRQQLLIPVILRPCSWTLDSRISELLACPSDGQPVTEWANIDLAWKNVCDHIDRAIKSHLYRQPIKIRRDAIDKINRIDIAGCETDGDYTLTNLFVDCQMLRLDTPVGGEYLIKSSLLPLNGSFAIVGDDKSGKTSIVNSIFLKSRDDTIAIKIDGEDLPADCNIEKLLQRRFEQLYDVNNGLSFLNYTTKALVLIVDNVDRIGMHKSDLSRHIANVFSSCVFTCSTSSYADAALSNLLIDMPTYRIERLSRRQRLECVQKWLAAQDPHSTSKEEDRERRLHESVTQFMHSGLIPDYPYFVYSYLAACEMLVSRDLSMSSYGHCYQSLITIQLKKSGIKNTLIDGYINILTELSYFLYCRNSEPIEGSELTDFLNGAYSSKYTLQESADKIIHRLTSTSCHLLQKTSRGKADSGFSFTHSYTYFYFVGRYIAVTLGSERAAQEGVISALCDKIHRASSAHILTFALHHCTNKSILEELILRSLFLLDNSSEATLRQLEVRAIADNFTRIPDIIIPQMSGTDKEFESHLADLDELDSIGNQHGNKDKNVSHDDDHEFARGIRTIEVIGSIMKSRSGSLRRKDQFELFQSAESLGLRMLGKLLSDLQGDDLIDSVESLIEAKFGPNSSVAKAEVRKFIDVIARRASIVLPAVVLNNISSLLGARGCTEAANEVFEKSDKSPARIIVNLFINLSYEGRSRRQSLLMAEEAYNRFEEEGNFYAMVLTRAYVAHYLRINAVENKQRDRICDVMGIKFGPVASIRKFLR